MSRVVLSSSTPSQDIELQNTPVTTTTTTTTTTLPHHNRISLEKHLSSIPHAITLASKVRYLRSLLGRGMASGVQQQQQEELSGERFPEAAVALLALYWNLQQTDFIANNTCLPGSIYQIMTHFHGWIPNWPMDTPPLLVSLQCKFYTLQWTEALKLVKSLSTAYPRSCKRYEALCCTLLVHYGGATSSWDAIVPNHTAADSLFKSALNFYQDSIFNLNQEDASQNHNSSSKLHPNPSIRESTPLNLKFESLFCFLKARKLNLVRLLIKDMMKHFVSRDELLTNVPSSSDAPLSIRYEQQRLLWLITVLLLTTTSSIHSPSIQNLTEAKSILLHLRKMDPNDVLYAILTIKISEAIHYKRQENDDLMELALRKSEEYDNYVQFIQNDVADPIEQIATSDAASLDEALRAVENRMDTTLDEPVPYINWEQLRNGGIKRQIKAGMLNAPAPRGINGGYRGKEATYNRNMTQHIGTCADMLVKNFERMYNSNSSKPAHSNSDTKNGDAHLIGHYQRNWRWCTLEIFNMFLIYHSYEKASQFVHSVSGYISTVDVLYFKGRLEQHKNQLDTARQHYDQCLYLAQNHVEANLEAAQLCFDSGDYVSARSFAQQSIKHHAGVHHRAHLLMGKILKELSMEKDAVKHLRICVEYERTMPLIHGDVSFVMESFLDSLVVGERRG